jgi:hypothetical protein
MPSDTGLPIETPIVRKTPWYRVEQRGKEYYITQRHKKSTERVEGTDVYTSRVSAFNALAMLLKLEYRKWD